MSNIFKYSLNSTSFLQGFCNEIFLLRSNLSLFLIPNLSRSRREKIETVKISTITGDPDSSRLLRNKTKSNGNYIHKIFRWAGRDTISPLFLRSFDTINENGSGSSLIVAADDTTSRSRKIFKGPVYSRVGHNGERERNREIRKKRWQKWRKEERSLVRGIEMEKRR